MKMQIFFSLTVLTITNMDMCFDENESVLIRNNYIDGNEPVFSRNIFVNLLITGWMTFTFSSFANFGFYNVHPRNSSKGAIRK